MKRVIRYKCPKCGNERDGRKYCIVCTRKAFQEYGVFVSIADVTYVTGAVLQHPELVVHTEEV